MILYAPFGALSGFISVAQTFLANRHGLTISEGSLLNGAQLMTQWLKWIWAPAVDVTLTPKRWYRISATGSALAILTISAIPLSQKTLVLMLLVIAASGIINSIVGMSTEAMMAAITPRSEIGRVSGWFQAGNLGGAGVGGGLGLLLLETLPAPWMTGAILGSLFMACCLVLNVLPDVASHKRLPEPMSSPTPLGTQEASAGNEREALDAMKGVLKDMRDMVRTREGRLAAFLCFLPVGTGAAQSVLAQERVAAHWGAGKEVVASVQGFASGGITMVGCFAGGWLCRRMAPRTAYAAIGVALGAVACGMALSSTTVTMYVVWNFIYAFGVGMAFAAFTAVVLDSMGQGSAATKYNSFASLSNFPIWWLGLLLAWVAQKRGTPRMLYTEAALGVVGVVLFAIATRLSRRTEVAQGATPEGRAG